MDANHLAYIHYSINDGFLQLPLADLFSDKKNLSIQAILDRSMPYEEAQV